MLKNFAISMLAGTLVSAIALAQAPSGAPAGSTGLCRDGSYWSGATKKGACHGHKGVQAWYGDEAAGTAAPTTPVAGTTAPTVATSATRPAMTATSTPKETTKPIATQAAGGGPGLVWVNASSKVYHCSTDRWYGKTKNGAYMSEADAVAKGNHPDHGNACK